MLQRPAVIDELQTILSDWVASLDSPKLVGAYLFGSTVNAGGVHFQPGKGDLDVMIVVDWEAASPVERVAQINALRVAKGELEVVLLKKLHWKDASKQIVSLVPITPFEIVHAVHKEGLSHILTGARAYDLFRKNEIENLGGGRSPRLEDRYYSVLRFVQKKRAEALSIAPNSTGGLSCQSHDDPVPKELMRNFAVATADLKKHSDISDLARGLSEISDFARASAEASPLTSDFAKWLAVQQGARGNVNRIISHDHYLLLVEAMFDRVRQQCAALDAEVQRARWTKATEEVAKNRATLERLGKAYHRAHDATPNFPLITRPGWLLDPPIPLIERKEHPPLRRDVPDVTGPKLFDGHGDYAGVKRSVATKWFNGLTFRVLEIKAEENTLCFTFGRGNYENYVNTCEYLGAELADAYLRGRPTEAGELPLRGQPEAIFDFTQRSAFAGVNCVVFLKGYEEEKVQPPGNYFVMHLRDEKVLEAQNTNHVVPAGGHQPGATTYGSDVEQDIWQTAVREFVEELFDKKEAAELSRGGSILANRQVQRAVDAIFRSGRAKLFLLGVGLDPVTTKPEILVAIVVDWRAVVVDGRLARFMKERGNDGREKILTLRIKENYEGTVRFPPLSPEKLDAEAAFPDNGKPVLPAGAACLRLAAKHYKLLFDAV